MLSECEFPEDCILFIITVKVALYITCRSSSMNQGLLGVTKNYNAEI